MPNINLTELLGGSIYPTKEKILASPIKHKREIVKTVKSWKTEEWMDARNMSPREKFEVIKSLLNNISLAYEKPVNVEFVPELPSCCYNPQTLTISINGTVSIISSLHELAHHLFGASELKACRWSIWLFKKTFPKAYAKLVWNQHTLVRSTPTCPTQQIASPGDSTISSE